MRRGGGNVPISARDLCCPCHKEILEQARLVNVTLAPQALTQWHREFISIPGLL